MQVYKVCICAHFGGNKEFFDGQTIKTKILYEELRQQFDEEAILRIDTYGWKKNFIPLLLACLRASWRSQNIIVLASRNGLRLFLVLFWLLGRIFNAKIHHVIIGGVFPEFIKDKPLLRTCAMAATGVYAETPLMIEKLENMGFTNAYYMPNFKKLNVLSVEDIPLSYEEPYKLCTFSRVSPEKGIEYAISAVIDINGEAGRTVFTLDIFGQIDEGYKKEFKKLLENVPNYISYKGIISFEKSTEVLKEYFILLFPTYFYGEGFAGTVIDAMSAGVPVIASDWNHNRYIIEEKTTGFIFKTHDNNAMKDILKNCAANPEIIYGMKTACLNKAQGLLPSNAVKALVSNFE